MADDLKYDLRVYGDDESYYDSCAAALASRINRYVDTEGVCSILLSGGSTPIPLYRRLAVEHADDIPWRRIHLFWGDERFVDRSDDRSNFRAIMKEFQTLDLTRAQVHPVPVAYPNADEAARAYEHELRLWFDGDFPDFDIALLGMGSDGHVASLFPGDPAIQESTRWAVAGTAPEEPRQRISVTLPVINASAEIHFLIKGNTKASLLKSLMTGQKKEAGEFPASLVRPHSGLTTIWADKSAASLIAS